MLCNAYILLALVKAFGQLFLGCKELASIDWSWIRERGKSASLAVASISQLFRQVNAAALTFGSPAKQ